MSVTEAYVREIFKGLEEGNGASSTMSTTRLIGLSRVAISKSNDVR
jgi:hypothetical protein